MLLEFTLYLLIGYTSLFIKKAGTFREIKKDITFIILWPLILLLKYVEMVDEVKRNSRQ